MRKKLTPTQIEFLRRMDRDGAADTDRSTGIVAAALVKRGLAKHAPIYDAGREGNLTRIAGFRFALTSEGRARLREIDAA